MLRLQDERSRQISFLNVLLPAAAAGVAEDLAKMDEWLDDERFFEPFRDRYHQHLSRPS